MTRDLAPNSIACVAGGTPGRSRTAPLDAVEFVGGPRARQHWTIPDPPSEVVIDGSRYRRSVQCADDGALRFVYVEVVPDP
jgi:hypothetical protein